MSVRSRVKHHSGHEFGHLFGANHNPENNSNPSMLHPWAQAHWANAQNPEDRARTVVSYQIGACHGTCPQVLNYSNAAVTLTKTWSFRTGVVDLRENARVIAELASITAQYDQFLDRIFANGFEKEARAMSIPMRIVVAMLTMFSSVLVHAGNLVVPADISVHLSAQPSINLSPGDPIVFTLTVANHGPESVGHFVLISSDF